MLRNIKYFGFHLLLKSTILSSLACAGPAINQFEVKDLDVDIGTWEFQSQNAHMWKIPKRKYSQSESGKFEYDDNSIAKQRHAFEMELGVNEKLRTRIGIEYEKPRLDDDDLSHARRDSFGDFELEELAMEVVYVFIPPRGELMGLGVLMEFQYAINHAESDSFVLSPILAGNKGSWSYVVNPGLVQHFGGTEEDNRLDLVYSFQLLRNITSSVELGLEAYGVVDRIGSTGKRHESSLTFGDHDQHRIGPVVYISNGFFKYENQSNLTIGLGLFEGLNASTPNRTLKWSLEYEF